MRPLRSASVARSCMVRRDVVGQKVARASTWLDDADTILSRPEPEFLAEARDRDLATFYLFLAIQECIDLAAHWSPTKAGRRRTTRPRLSTSWPIGI